MKRLAFTAIFLLFLCLAPSPKAGADLIDPDFFDQHCRSGERLIEAKNERDIFDGPDRLDQDLFYEGNSHYYYLIGAGSSFGGTSKWCLREGYSDNAMTITKIRVLAFGLLVSVVGLLSWTSLKRIRMNTHA